MIAALRGVYHLFDVQALWMVLNRQAKLPGWTQVQRMLQAPDFKRRVVEYEQIIDPALQQFILHKLFAAGFDSLELHTAQITSASAVCGILWRWVCSKTKVDKQNVKAACDVAVSDTGHTRAAVNELSLLKLRSLMEAAQDECMIWEDEFNLAESEHVKLADSLGLDFVWAQYKGS